VRLARRLLALQAVTLTRLVAVTGLAIGYAITQGASVGILLPLVHLLDSTKEDGAGGPIGRIMDGVFSTLGLPYSLVTLSIAVLAVVTIAQLMGYGHQHLSVQTSQKLGADLRLGLFKSIMYASMPFHFANRESSLTSTLIDDVNRSSLAFRAMQELLIRSLVIVGYAALLMVISWEASLAGVMVIALVTLLTQFWLPQSRRIGQSISMAHETMQGLALERIQGVREVKLAGRESRESDRFSKAADDLARARAKLMIGPAQIRAVTEPTLIGTGLIILYVGSVAFGLTLAELAVFAYALIRVTPEARQLNNARYGLAGNLNSMRRVFCYIDAARGLSEEQPQEATTTFQLRPFTGPRNQISFNAVSFKYGQGQEVLTQLSFSLDTGQTTAIVGPSGVGKSTLLAMIVRLVTPVSGQILVDGVPLEEFDLTSLRRKVALVTQESALFNETVFENIRFAQTEATPEEVAKVARTANAEEFIQQLPEGYETIIGERGTTLSAGQRQRIALARALLLDPPVLLLDEITSAQDPESERAIQEAVWQASTGRTVLIVTHRLSSIQGVDRVLVLENGRIAEDGSPKELLRSNGLFRQYYDYQIGSGWA
jgi:subfamily B ATP-binding cassette protein MsbA